MTSDKDYLRIERAIHYLAQHTREQPALPQVAAHVGLSAYHFQRLFRRWAGISPKRFLQYLTAERARELLQTSRSVLDASYDTGLSGAGRLHDLMVAIHAATPGEIKARGAGLTIDYGVHPTPFGECFVAVTQRGICALEFVTPSQRAAVLTRLRSGWSAATLRSQPRATRAIVDQLFKPASNGQSPPQLLVRGTNFQIKVWEALLCIPPGHIASYEDVAHVLGTPRATRAVASAVAQNPVAFLIPCHRVIRKTGAFGEYRWGAPRKQALLAWEAARFSMLPND
jgi:AraC family transcriptional regulator, regulatory protein of adaptative response / methylated-DNA-[protein]-cysteine methyltransferase